MKRLVRGLGREDGWWTSFPPPAGLDGEEEGEPGDPGYKRVLSEAEQAGIEADEADDRTEAVEMQTARRDRYFGFDGSSAQDEIFSPREAETLKLPPEQGAQRSSKPIAKRCERPADRAAKRNLIDVTAQWCRDGTAQR